MGFGDTLRRKLEEQVKRRLGRRVERYVRTAEQMVGTEQLAGYRKWMDLPARNRALLRREHDEKVVRVSSYPEEITLATTIRCNKNPPCAICERNVRSADLEWDCPDIIIERLKPVLPHLDILYLHCSGEPLFYHGFGDLLRAVRPPTKVRFNSNGVLLTEEKIGLIMETGVVDVINFSLDAATEQTYRKIRGRGFEQVVANIKNLTRAKEKLGGGPHEGTPFIVVNMCITKANYRELPAFVRLAHELGAGAIDLFHMNKGLDWRIERPDGFVFDYQEQEELDPEEHDAIILESHALAKELGLSMNFVGAVFLAEQESEEKQEVGAEIKELNRWEDGCLAPWSRAVVGVDGNVRICYFHKEWDESVGNLIFDSFDEIWNGDKARQVRQEFIERGHAKFCEKENHCMFLGRV